MAVEEVAALITDPDVLTILILYIALVFAALAANDGNDPVLWVVSVFVEEVFPD